MIRNVIEKSVLSVLKRSLKLWFKLSKKDPDGHITETILELIEQDEDGGRHAIDADERALLGNVLDLKDTTVSSIQIPRAEIVMVPNQSSVEEILDTMIEKKMSQLIIYKDEIDNILGYVIQEEIISCYKNPKCKFDLKNFLKPLDFIAPSMQILDCLLTMREKGQKMAIVVDEYGSVDGLVTFTDLIEEIIGDIQEGESINPPGEIVVKENGEVLVDGHTRLDEMDETLGVNLKQENEGVHTIAGLICEAIGRLPSRGEVILYKNNVEFLILDATPRKINRICIRNLQIQQQKKHLRGF